MSIIISNENIKLHKITGDIEEIAEEHLLFNLYEIVELQDITLERIFNIISKETSLCELLIQEKVEEVLQESKKEPIEKTDLNKLKVVWDSLISQREFELYPTIYGYDEAENEFSIDFLSANCLKNLPIELVEDVMVDNTDCINRKMPALLYLGKKPFTLVEVIKTIFSELTFYGNPKQRDKAFETIKKISEEVEENLK